MKSSGLDLAIFTPHTGRSASTNTALRANVPLQSILATAGWTRESTFSRYYNKPVQDTSYSTKIIEVLQKKKDCKM